MTPKRDDRVDIEDRKRYALEMERKVPPRKEGEKPRDPEPTGRYILYIFDRIVDRDEFVIRTPGTTPANARHPIVRRMLRRVTTVDTFDRMVVRHFDADGRLSREEVVHYTRRAMP